MRVSEAIATRRAIKQFDPEHQLSEADQDRLIELAMQSPTAFNLQHWRFVVVRDPARRQAIREVAWDQAQVTDASMLVILTGRRDVWQNEAERVWRDAPAEVREMMAGAIDAYYRDKPQVERDEVMRSCGIAGQSLMLAAREMGLDSCPMDGFDFEAVGRLINLPDDHLISFMVAIGKKAGDVWPRPGQLSIDEVRRVDGF
ncbi:nitroreductase family protein [Guyparkeria halophila]|uniref:Nitroreductase family protein n=1 Tax=Guyparkeria halophila TaxID=47960 RepID=A0A6I6D4G5_9GAMM|nr:MULTISPECIES: nitroreductase family protein [Guyparkeria]QGT78251.1 nitroreductase family protein [Guyparkeria halophila]TKA91895.1 nitroreductase family protein [Guyparkeria sp. SB14A]